MKNEYDNFTEHAKRVNANICLVFFCAHPTRNKNLSTVPGGNCEKKSASTFEMNPCLAASLPLNTLLCDGRDHVAPT